MGKKSVGRGGSAGVTTNLRVSLSILSVGFAVEGLGDAYSFVSHGQFRPGSSLLVVLPAVVTLAGLLFVWIGRHEWDELHRQRVRRAHHAFGASLLGALAAAAVVATLYLLPGLGVPPAAEAVFGAAIAALVFGTFLTYVLLVFHLVGRPSRAVLVVAALWAAAIAALVGLLLAQHLPTILGLVRDRRPSVPAFVSPIDALASYLFFSYFLLFAAYVDAHRVVAAGRAAPD